MKYKLVESYKAEDVAKLAVCLTNEIVERTGVKHFDVNVQLAVDLCETYIVDGHYHVMAAFDGEKIVAFGSLCESIAFQKIKL